MTTQTQRTVRQHPSPQFRYSVVETLNSVGDRKYSLYDKVLKTHMHTSKTKAEALFNSYRRQFKETIALSKDLNNLTETSQKEKSQAIVQYQQVQKLTEDVQSLKSQNLTLKDTLTQKEQYILKLKEQTRLLLEELH